MHVNVCVDVDPEEVLRELTNEELAAYLAKRTKVVPEENPTVVLRQVYEDFRARGDAPKSLRDYLWTVLGRCLP